MLTRFNPRIVASNNKNSAKLKVVAGFNFYMAYVLNFLRDFAILPFQLLLILFMLCVLHDAKWYFEIVFTILAPPIFGACNRFKVALEAMHKQTRVLHNAKGCFKTVVTIPAPPKVGVCNGLKVALDTQGTQTAEPLLPVLLNI
eukprot:Gb_37574 [translate_table: standard]